MSDHPFPCMRNLNVHMSNAHGWKEMGFEVLVVGWMTHSLVVDDPPNDPQYGVEHLAEGLVGTGQSPLG